MREQQRLPTQPEATISRGSPLTKTEGGPENSADINPSDPVLPKKKGTQLPDEITAAMLKIRIQRGDFILVKESSAVERLVFQASDMKKPPTYFDLSQQAHNILWANLFGPQDARDKPVMMTPICPTSGKESQYKINCQI